MLSSLPNIAIVLTPPSAAGGSAIAVIRIRGPAAGEFLRRRFSKPTAPGRCVHGELRDGDQIIDDPVVVQAEDGFWADLCLHGGAWVIESALELMRREGFEIVPAGAVPVPDAALDDAASTFEKEVLAHLPTAMTEPAIRMLLDQPIAWRREINRGIDARAILEDRTLWRLLNPPKIAIVGEPNVGKSTLANRLFGTERSITADLPGTTRDWVGEMADIDGLAVMLVDTPGQREAVDAIEHAAIAAGRNQILGSELVILVLNAQSPPAMPMDSCGGLTVVNKSDLAHGWDFSSLDALAISAKTGAGIKELCRAVHRRLGVVDINNSRPCWWTQRQKHLLMESIRNPRALTSLLH